MKILILTGHTQGTDGWSRYSTLVSSALSGLGHEVTCVTSRSSNGVSKKLLSTPRQYLENPLRAYVEAPRLRKVIREVDPDVIHVHVEPYALLIPLLGNIRAKVFFTVHGTYAYLPDVVGLLKGFVARSLIHRALQQVDRVISVSAFTKDRLLGLIPGALREVVARKIVVIPNPVLMPVRQAGLSRRKDHYEVLFVGAVKSRKGLAEAIKGLAAFLPKATKPLTYRIVGAYDPNDPYVAKVKKLAEQCAITVIFEGRVGEDALHAFYDSADLFLMLSQQTEGGNMTAIEGFGIVYLEANSHGVPVIGSSDSGAQEAIQNGVTGYLVCATDFGSVAERIDAVLNHHQIRREDCISWANQHRSEVHAQKLVELFQ